MLVGRGRDRTDRRPGDNEAEGVDRVARIGCKDHVARRGHRRRHARKALFRAHRDDHLAFGIEFDSETAGVIVRLRLAQPGDAFGLRIAMRIGLLRHLAQLVDYVLRRRQVGIAHAEVDDIPARLACRVAHRIDFGDDIGRQALDAVEFVFHDLVNPVVRHDCRAA